MFDWPGNSADLTSIEEVWNIMKKKSGKLPNNKKITFVVYGVVFKEKLLKNCMMKCLQWWKLCVSRKWVYHVLSC